MNILKRELCNRNNNIIHISRFFLKFELTQAANDNFVNVITEGLTLTNLLQNSSEIDEELKIRIKNYFISGQEALYAAGLEVPDQHCEVLEILEDFRDQGLLINEFLSGNLTDSMFI